MIPADSRDVERKIISILRVLSGSSEPLGSTAIAREIEKLGVSLSERAVRYHLRLMDERGYTAPRGRDGRAITEHGRDELRSALAADQVGFIIARIELLAFLTSFNPERRQGEVVINTSFFTRDHFGPALLAMKGVFDAGLCVSDRVAIAAEGERLGDIVVPPGKVGLATVCSVTINGVLLKAGIPMESKFAGVLEMRDGTPRRFASVIYYSGSSLDPSEQYIRAGMTSVGQAARTGSGRILANFREIPAPARPLTEQVLASLREAGIRGMVAIGNASEPLCQVAVGLNRAGVILLGGLNPVAAAVEAGIPVDNFAESGTIDWQRLVSFHELLRSA